jgi:hypothetical protein
MSTERTLYVVVHGVGDPPLGKVAENFARGRTRTAGVTCLREEELLIPEDDYSGADPRTQRAFPVPVRHDDAAGVTVAEVHWADLSRFSVSVLGLVEGFFGVLFGLRYIAYQALSKLDAPGVTWLRRLSRWITGILIGPAAAMNVLVLLLLAGSLIADQFVRGSFVVSPFGDVVAVVVCLVGIGLGVFVALWWGENQLLRTIGWWLVGNAVVVLVFAVVVWAGGPSHHEWCWKSPLVEEWKKELDRPGGPRAKLPTDCSAVASPPSRQPWAGLLTTAVFANLLLGGYFVALHIIALVSAVVYLRCLWHAKSRPEVRRAATVAFLLPFVMLFAWAVVVPTAWVGLEVGLEKVFPGSPFLIAVYHALLVIVMPALAVMYSFTLVVGVVAVGVWLFWALRQWRLRRGDWPALPDDGRRLLLAATLQWVLGLLYVIVAIAVVCGFVGTVLKLAGADAFRNYLDDQLQFDKQSQNIAFVVGAVVGVGSLVLSQLVPYLRAGLKLVYDIINHFHFQYRDADAGRTGRELFRVRDAIQNRLRATLRHFAARPPAPGVKWRVVIVSHSQGTVIAVETLNDGDPTLDVMLTAFGSVQLVTMGSPFTHIYQHYFRQHYPELNEAAWATLAARLRKPKSGGPQWVNVFRTDDYVGRVIDESRPHLVTNVPVNPRGHIGYWVDGEVLAVLEGHHIIRRGGAAGGPA